MKTSTAALIAAACGSLASAEQQYTIDPNNVLNTTRAEWCNTQKQTCPLICLQSPGVTGTELNTCDPDALQYQCICSNGLSPNITEYTQTLPYFICTEWGTECVTNCGIDNLCAADCRQQHPCGAQAPTRVNISTSSTTSMSKTASATSSGGALYTGAVAVSNLAATGAAASIKPITIQFGQTWGLAAVMTGFFGAFAILL